MANIEKHLPGEFCWIELATSDQNAAKDFYTQIFGWTPKDAPIGPNDIYTIFQLQGRDAAAACTLRPEQTSMGVPPHWNLYVAVESAEPPPQKLHSLAAEFWRRPLMLSCRPHGRPAGSHWRCHLTLASEKEFGNWNYELDGTLCWADLSTPDQARAGQFYSDLFGWSVMKEDEDPAHNYWHIKNGEDFIGGIPPASQNQPGVPPHWLPYFTVSDCDATSQKANQFGARLYMPPTDFEDIGRISVMADPQGATFAIFKVAAGRGGVSQASG